MVVSLRLKSMALIMLTLLLGAQLAFAQIHCGILPNVEHDDCALCHAADLQFVEGAEAASEVAPAPAVALTAEPCAAPVSAAYSPQQGRAPPTHS